MLRIFLLIGFLLQQLIGATYETSLLQIHAKIVPRIALMLEPMPQRETVSIVLLCQSADLEAAENLKLLMERSYPSGLGKKTLQVHIERYNTFEKAGEGTLLFLFDAPEAVRSRVITYAVEEHFLCMSYNASYLKEGVHASLHLGRNVQPYLNLLSARQSGIIFQRTLISVSKIYNPKDQP